MRFAANRKERPHPDSGRMTKALTSGQGLNRDPCVDQRASVTGLARRETGTIPSCTKRCVASVQAERTLGIAFNKRAQERPLQLDRFATEAS